MATNVNRSQVFKTTRVRTSLKRDGSWIHKAKGAEEEEEKPCENSAVDTKSLAARQYSYVLSTAKKFGSITSPVSPPFEKPEFFPAEGDSDNHANAEVIPATNDTQPKDTTAETTELTNPEEPIQNGVVEQASPASGNSEGVQPTEQPVTNTTAEHKGEHVDAPVDQSDEEPKEGATEVSADAAEENHVGESSAEASSVMEQSQETAEVPAELTVELKAEPVEKPDVGSSAETEPENAPNLRDAGVESNTPAVEESCEVCPPEDATAEAAPQPAEEQTVQTVFEATVKSAVESNSISNVAPGTESTLQDAPIVEPTPEIVADSVSESPSEPAAEPTVKSEESNAESAAQVEPNLKAEAEVVVECEVQSAVEAAVEQSVESAHETAADPMIDSNVKIAAEPTVDPVGESVQDHVVESIIQKPEATNVEASTPEPVPQPVTDSVGESVQNEVVESAIQQAEATNVEASTPEAVPEPVPEPVAEQSNSEEVKLNQESAGTNSSEMLHNPVEDVQTTYTLPETRDGRAVCSFCDKVIDGNVKISLSYPPIQSHPDCLKCGVCSKVLGDMLTAMFLHGQVIHCESCFAKVL